MSELKENQDNKNIIEKITSLLDDLLNDFAANELNPMNIGQLYLTLKVSF